MLQDARAAAEAIGASDLAAAADEVLAGTPAVTPAADERPVLLAEGDWWTLAYGGCTTRHRAGKAFRYLRVLLQQPRRAIDVLDLVATVEGTDRAHVSATAISGRRWTTEAARSTALG